MNDNKTEQMKMESLVTKVQLTAVTILTVAALAAGIFIAALYGNFLMRPNDMQNQAGQAYFSQSIVGLPETKATETVELKNGDTYNLSASIVKKNIKGQEIRMLAYNGSIPGPVIKVAQGSTVTVNFTNNTDVDSTLHPHGVRVENQFDGVPDVTQKAVKPGESFTYKVTFPDAGVFWYHPHLREDYAQASGLYGNFLVTPTSADYYSSANIEVPLMISDILLENGAIVPFDKNVVTRTLMGRFGNTMLMNGQTDYNLNVSKGEVVRFYLTDTANTRTFNLTIPGAKIKLVGGDNGKYEKEAFTDSVLIAPSERVIIEVLFDTAGTFKFINKTPDQETILGSVTVSDTSVAISYASQFSALRTNADTTQTIDALRPYFTNGLQKNLTLSMSLSQNQQMGSMSGMQGMNMSGGNSMTAMQGMQNDSSKIEWEDTMAQMNSMTDTKMVSWKLIDTDTKKGNADINWQFKKGDKVLLTIFNDPNSPHPMQHPIHIHGQRFLVLSTNSVTNTNMVFKDTVLVQKGDTVKLLVDMENAGTWLIHCHIPEHMEAGMMLKYRVL